MKRKKINNSIYENLGDKWYLAKDDPIALLREESNFRNPWVLETLQKHNRKKETSHILDLGCGGGFLSNFLSKKGYKVTGLDSAEDALKVARKFDQTKNVNYIQGSAYNLPFEEKSFDVVCAMDFLEHVESPEEIIAEISRVLKPGGQFFFYTFNRNILSWLFVIKGVEWILKKTPDNLHVYHLFIKPKELEHYCKKNKLLVQTFKGVGPQIFHKNFLKFILKREVPQHFPFAFKKSLHIGYLGYALKN
jgi:2-polyprenyl-6-hydroxyphenyl methylase/3-demethylubiquinone-9 3-methyltransferase